MRRITPPRSINAPAPPNGTSGLTPARAKPAAAGFVAVTLTIPLLGDGDSVTVREGTTPPAGDDAWPDSVVGFAMLPCLISASVPPSCPAVHDNVPSGASNCVSQVTVNP